MAGLFIPAAVLLSLGFAAYRTGSIHLLLSRVWLLVFGKLNVSDETVERFLANRDAFMKFRLVTGLKPRTLEQAKALIAWCEEHKEDVGDVKACGSYFDVEKLQLYKRLPGKLELMVITFFTVLLPFAVYGTASSAILLPPAFKVNASGNWYWVDGERALQVGRNHSDRKRLSKANCQNTASSDLLDSDAKALCPLLGEKGASERASALRGQQAILGSASLVLGVFWLLLILFRREIMASKAMEARLKA